MGQDAKADVITHPPRDKALDTEAARCMVAEKRISVPALTIMEGVLKPPKISSLLNPVTNNILLAIMKAKRQNVRGGDQTCEITRDSVIMMYQAGVPILVGTCTDSEPGSLSPVIHGDVSH